ncbi:serine hydrolase domain-containing protein [Maribacter sp. Asnod2-G09]|uniref:serine hydrolase domain-containing protein n=1 Tax=Maribacter sp. Asnod2-G09 TaxID=3160577 RepID=UPI003865B258
MKKHYLKSIAVIFLLLLVFSCTPEVDEFGEDFDRDKMDLFFSRIEDKNLGMGSISIFKDGKEDYQTSFGFIDVEKSILANSASKYRIGSISKTFTATMIMQLVEENKLSLDTTLDNYFPEIPNAAIITIEHLLRHRSGLFNYTSGEFEAGRNYESATRSELIDYFISNGIIFEPNDKYEYSNTNYVLLSFIIEDLDTKTYDQSLNDRIAVPLNLIDTYNGGVTNSENNEAFSYYLENDNWTSILETHYTILQGTGSIISSAKGVNIFYQALFDGKLISEDSLILMTTMVDGYGFGLNSPAFYNKKGFGHAGSIDGFGSSTVYFRSDNVTVTYVSNGIVMVPNDVLIGILSIYSGLDYDLP